MNFSYLWGLCTFLLFFCIHRIDKIFTALPLVKTKFLLSQHVQFYWGDEENNNLFSTDVFICYEAQLHPLTISGCNFNYTYLEVRHSELNCFYTSADLYTFHYSLSSLEEPNAANINTVCTNKVLVELSNSSGLVPYYKENFNFSLLDVLLFLIKKALYHSCYLHFIWTTYML